MVDIGHIALLLGLLVPGTLSFELSLLESRFLALGRRDDLLVHNSFAPDHPIFYNHIGQAILRIDNGLYLPISLLPITIESIDSGKTEASCAHDALIGFCFGEKAKGCAMAK